MDSKERDPDARPVDEAKISAANQAIEAFFQGKEKNQQRVEWVNPKRETIPKDLRDIYNSMRVFFRGRKWGNGGPIPNELLYTRKNFHLINNITLIDSIDLAYASIDLCKALVSTVYKEGMEIDITLCVLAECGKKNIPQDHIAGLLLLYLELCERVVLLD